MRRKKDDKRVLRAGNGRNTRNNRRNINRKSFGFSNNRQSAPYTRQKKQKKRSNKTVFLMIMVLLAFVVGAGVGVMFSFDSGDEDANNETHIENVTVEMTTNLNETEEITFDEADAVDYNENQTDIILKDENAVYYDPYEDIQT